MWANAQRDGRPAEYRWRPLFNAAKFGWRPILECRAVTLPRRETSWNLQGYPKVVNRSQLLVGQSSPEANQSLHDVWPYGLVHYIYIFGGSSLGQNFARCKIHFTSKSCVRLGSVTAWRSSSGRQRNFASWYQEWTYELSQRAPPIVGRAAITLGIGPHF